MVRDSNLRIRRAGLVVIAGCLVGCQAASIGPLRAEAPNPASALSTDGLTSSAETPFGATTGSAADTPISRAFQGPVPGLVFAKNRAALDEQGRAALQPLLQALRREPQVVIELQGHTDNRGSAGGNLVLSKRRVMAVVRFLVTEGVEPSRLQPWGFGENRPVASNATAEGRARNRRIEVRVIMPRNENE